MTNARKVQRCLSFRGEFVCTVNPLSPFANLTAWGTLPFALVLGERVATGSKA